MDRNGRERLPWSGLRRVGTTFHIEHYARFIADGLPSGSGPVEAACKTVVENRLKRSGMRWSIAGGQHILNLRCPLKSGRWEHARAVYLGRAA